MLELIVQRFEQWQRGEMHGREAAVMVDVMERFLAKTDAYIERLKALRDSDGNSPELDTEIRRAAGEHTTVAKLWNQLVAKVHEDEKQKNNETPAAVHWSGPQSATNDWVRPRQEGFRFGCCSCDAVHILEFRIVDGAVEYRAFAAPPFESDNKGEQRQCASLN